MTKPINTEPIENATGKPWRQWMEELDAAGAREFSHANLAQLVIERLGLKVDNPGIQRTALWIHGLQSIAYIRRMSTQISG